MDIERKKQLQQEYKNRHPEMGVISFRCKESGEVFLGISRDTRTDFNSTRAKLSFGCHPNKRLQALWNQYGENGFELTVPKILKYEDPSKDYTCKLETLRDACLSADGKASRIWR